MKVQFDIHFYFFRRGKHAFYDKRYICCQKGSKYWFGICYKKGGRVEQETSGTGQRIIFCSLTAQGTQSVLWLHSRKCWVSYIHSVIVFGKDQETFFIRRILFGSTNKPVGANTLGFFMEKTKCIHKLSQVYLNHSIWVIGATLLSRQQYCSKQIMSVTGHKSVSSLTDFWTQNPISFFQTQEAVARQQSQRKNINHPMYRHSMAAGSINVSFNFIQK